MIAEEIQEIVVERTMIVKQENLARKNYKIRDWLKLISLLQEDKNYHQIDVLLASQIHQNFILNQSFWVAYIRRKFTDTELTRQHVEMAMLALNDGPYFDAATIIADRLIKQIQIQKYWFNFCLSVLEKMLLTFDYDGTFGSFIFKRIRTVYELMKNSRKVRETYQRQLRKGYDDFDVTFDEYMSWQKDENKKNQNQGLYELAKKVWEQNSVNFDQALQSESNIKRSIFAIENQNKSKIDEPKYIEWIQKLPTDQQKLWFLRRVALNYRQMIPQYLIKLQTVISNHQEDIIKKFKVAIRLSQNSLEIQRMYITFLVRRINLHLDSSYEQQQYFVVWGDNVTFLRQQINVLLNKQRKVLPPEQANISLNYYKLWIQIEQKIIKDKIAVCKLYEILLKDCADITLYQDYAESLINLNSLKQAKNVLKRYIYHAKNVHSKQVYKKFIGLFGSITDDLEFIKEQKNQNSSIEEMKVKQNKKQIKNANSIIDQEQLINVGVAAVQHALPENNQIQKKQESVKRPRQQYKDQLQQKIEAGMRKKLHMDGDFTVYVRGIPLDWKESDVMKILKLSNRVVRISLVVKNNEQRDYCYVQYDSKEAAEQQVKLNDSGYRFNISKPPSEYDQSKTLFVCALPSSANQQKVLQLFGQCGGDIVEVRLKLQRDKNYAYVDFKTQESKIIAFQQIQGKNLLIDSKKVIVQLCDSNRQRNKKLLQVVFLKNIAFKVTQQNIREYFKDREITKIAIPKNQDNRSKGYAYVEFQKFKDYQEVLDMRRGQLFGREFLILKSDRKITEHTSQPRKDSSQIKQKSHDNKSKSKQSQKEWKEKDHRKSSNQNAKKEENRDNNFFSNLFK